MGPSPSQLMQFQKEEQGGEEQGGEKQCPNTTELGQKWS
jgi:hypothetical protein